jgi:hypothetical protein
MDISRTCIASLLACAGCALPPFELGSGAGGAGGTGGESSSTQTTGTASAGGSTSATSNSAATAGGGGGSPAQCGPDEVCIPPVPADWSGPVTLLEGDETAAGCTGATVDTGSKLVIVPPECSCSCGLACSGIEFSFYQSQASCSNPSTGTLTLTTNCTQAAGWGTPSSWWKAQVSKLPSCPPKLTKAIPPLPTGPALLVCDSITTSTACGDGLCVDNPSTSSRVCVHRSGAAQCPIDYPIRVGLTHSTADVIDSRSCDSCTCGPPGAQNCQGLIKVFYNSTCSGTTPYDSVASGACSGGWWVDSQGMKAEITGPSCQPMGGTPTGAVELAPTGRTVCCLDLP